jgi:hypothetical protein
MRFRFPLFAFVKEEETVAVIQAANKKQARERAFLISHIIKIPTQCKVKALRHRTVCRSPVFFDGHFRAIEAAIESGCGA